MTLLFQFITIIFGLAITYFTAKIVDSGNIGWKIGIAIIIVEWFIFLHIYYSIWPEALN